MTTEEPFSLKRALASIHARVTDDQRAAQDTLNRVGRNLLSQKIDQNRYAIARQQEASILATIAMLEEEPDGELKDQRMNIALDRLSELYAEQGKYEDAIGVTPNTARREWFQKIKNAIERDGSDKCDCPPEIIVDRKNNQNIRQSMFQKIGTVYNPATGRYVPLRICRACGHSNTE